MTTAETRKRPSRPDEAGWCAALARRVGDGDALALEQLYDRYGRPAYVLARRVTQSSTLAEDVVQEVFLALWRRPEAFRPEHGAFAGWLLAAVHHKAVDAVRREEAVRRRVTSLQAAAGPDRSDSADAPTEETAERRIRGRQVRRALAELPESQRRVLTLAYYGGYTQQEIASLTDTPLGTVKTRTYRAMRALRIALDEPFGLAADPISGEGGGS